MTKISDLTALTGAGVDAANDLVPIVDMSETGAARNKKITIAELKIALGVPTAYTDEMVRDVVAAALVAGSNITITNDDPGDTITIAASGGLTAEQVMDQIAAMLVAGTNVTLTYNDALDTLTIASSGGGGGGSGDMLAANNLSDVSSKVAAKDNISVKGTDIASASTTDLSGATGDFVTITGTTTITAFGTCAAGVERTLHFSGALTLTHNATSLILPTGSNIVTTAGDVAVFRSRGSGNWRCVSYQRASGAALGAALSPLIPGELTKPSTSQFTLVSGAGSPSMSDVSRGVRLAVPGAGAVDRNALLEVTPAGSTWTLTALLVPNGWWRNYFTFGVYAKESGTGKIHAFTQGYNGGILARQLRWTNITTFSASTDVPTLQVQGPMWFKLQLDATNLTYSIGQDGETWLQVAQVAKGTFLSGTIDRAGVWLGVNQQTTGSYPQNITEYLTVMSFTCA